MTKRKRLMLRIGIAAFAILLFTADAWAHDIWIGRGGFHNRYGQLCCGEKDCEIVNAREVNGGYRVFFSRGGVISEFVPESETLPSQDGLYWRCHRFDGQRLCFFAPPRTM